MYLKQARTWSILHFFNDKYLTFRPGREPLKIFSKQYVWFFVSTASYKKIALCYHREIGRLGSEYPCINVGNAAKHVPDSEKGMQNCSVQGLPFPRIMKGIKPECMFPLPDLSKEN